jgi:hypothetical protein
MEYKLTTAHKAQLKCMLHAISRALDEDFDFSTEEQDKEIIKQNKIAGINACLDYLIRDLCVLL